MDKLLTTTLGLVSQVNRMQSGLDSMQMLITARDADIRELQLAIGDERLKVFN